MTATIHDGNKLTINTYGVNCSGCAKGRRRSQVVVNGFNEEMRQGGRESPAPAVLAVDWCRLFSALACARATAGAPGGRPVDDRPASQPESQTR
jgi:hypothetical protein